MTAREFLEWAGYEVNQTTLFALTQYVGSDIDFSQFPDAEVLTADGTPLSECTGEPALFQEWMEIYLHPPLELEVEYNDIHFQHWTGTQDRRGPIPAQNQSNQGKEDKNDL